MKKKVARYSIEDQYLMGAGGSEINLDEIIKIKYQSLFDRVKKGEFFRFIIVLNDSKEVIGSIGLSLNIFNKFGNLSGIYLLKNFRRRGYGTEAVKLLCFYAFIILGLRKMNVNVFSSNIGAIKCYKKAGFKEVGRLKAHFGYFGKYEDVILMELFKEEFLEKEKEFVKKILELNNIH